MKVVHDLPHKYEKRNIGSLKKYYVQHCALKNCTHYLTFKAVIGMESVCWKCGSIFPMTRATARLRRPRCLNCKESRSVQHVDKTALADVLGRLGIK